MIVHLLLSVGWRGSLLGSSCYLLGIFISGVILECCPVVDCDYLVLYYLNGTSMIHLGWMMWSLCEVMWLMWLWFDQLVVNSDQGLVLDYWLVIFTSFHE